MSGAPNTQGGVSYDENGRMQEAQPGRKRGGMPGLAAARGGFFSQTGAAAAGGGGEVNTMGGAPQTIDPEWASQNPEDAQAKLIEIQREDFNARYRPLEEAAIAEFMKSPEQAAQRAGGIAAQGFHGGTGAADRSMGRMGASMTGDQRRAAGEATGLAQARAVGTAENTTRRAMTDRNIDGLGQMIGIGKGLFGAANRDVGAASSMADQREQAYQGQKAAHKPFFGLF